MAQYKHEPDVETIICNHLKNNDVNSAESMVNAYGGLDYAFRYGYESLAKILDALPINAHLGSEVFLGVLSEKTG